MIVMRSEGLVRSNVVPLQHEAVAMRQSCGFICGMESLAVVGADNCDLCEAQCPVHARRTHLPWQSCAPEMWLPLQDGAPCDGGCREAQAHVCALLPWRAAAAHWDGRVCRGRGRRRQQSSDGHIGGSCGGVSAAGTGCCRHPSTTGLICHSSEALCCCALMAAFQELRAGISHACL